MNVLIFSAALLSLGAPSSELEKAYLKELAFLKAEKTALTGRIDEQQQRTERRKKASEASLATLQSKLQHQRRLSQTLERKLTVAESAPEASEGLARLSQTLERAKNTGDAEGATAADAGPEELGLALKQLMQERIAALADASRVRRSSGSFFLTDGTKVDGDIVHFGEVMAWGIAPEGAGALAPAGAGRFRLWPTPARETAQAWLAKSPPKHLRGFLFEPTDVPIDPDRQRSMFDELQAGGLIAWIIFALGALALLLIVWRSITLVFASAQIRHVAKDVEALVASGETTKALHFTETQRGPAARVLQTALRHRGRSRQDIDDAVDEALLEEAPPLERFATAIVVFAAVAPLLGLLGTVTGMISTFDVITEFGTGDPRMLSGGISEALITTKLGLLVAIPSLLAGTLLSGRSDRLLADLDHAALSVGNSLRGLDHPPTPPAAPPASTETDGHHHPLPSLESA